MQLDNRFSSHEAKCIQLQLLVPKFLSTVSFTDLRGILELYTEDIDEETIVEAEFDRWKVKWMSVDPSQHPCTISDALAACDRQCFPNICTLLHIFLTVPVTSATAERSFSTMKRLLNYLRNTMGQDRLTSLALLSIHRDIEAPVEAIIDELSKKGRRLNFVL
jgi:hypothetical protein